MPEGLNLEKINSERINHLDQKLDQLIRDLPGMIKTAVDSSVAPIYTIMSEHKRQDDAVHGWLGSSNSGSGADWKALIAGVGLVITVIFAMHNSASQQIGFLANQISDRTEEIKRLDSSLQREMRDLDAGSKSERQALDNMLQREMVLRTDALARDIEVNTKNLDSLNTWQLEIEDSNARLSEGVRSNNDMISVLSDDRYRRSEAVRDLSWLSKEIENIREYVSENIGRKNVGSDS